MIEWGCAIKPISDPLFMETSIQSVASREGEEATAAAQSPFAMRQPVSGSKVGLAGPVASRIVVFRWAVLILLANQLLAVAKEGGPSISPDTITRLLSVGMFQYMAWYGVFRLLGTGDRSKTASDRDWVAALGLCLMVFIPARQLIWVAATAIGVYLLLTAARDHKLRSAAIVLLALSLQELWAHQLFELFASPLLRAETAIVGMMLQTVQTGTDWHDNIIMGRHWGIVVYPYCSSFHNLSLALLCWVTISSLAYDIWRGRDFVVAGVIGFTMISMNMIRLFMMSLNEDLYHYWHDGTGNQIFAVVASVVVLLVSLFAVRRAGARR